MNERLKKPTQANNGANFSMTMVGEINLDLILYGLPHELPFEREVLADGFQMTLGSSSAILAHNMATLGASIAFITCVGRDEFGQLALSRLAESGVDLSRTVRAEGTVGTGVTVLLARERERRILTYPGTMAELTCADLDIDYLASAGHFHLSSLFLQTGLHKGLKQLLTNLRSRGLTVSLDTNDDPLDRWDGVLHEILPLVDILLPNESEILRMANTSTLADALAKTGVQVPLIAVKCGSRGALVYERGHSTPVPAVPVVPVDTIGAGDSFNAGFLTMHLKGESPVSCAAFGNVTGALSTLRTGGTEAFRDVTLRDEFLRSHWPAAR
jgi:sugar/nucleoside kinase (ribokinase family)